MRTHIKIQNTGDYYDLYGGEKFATLAGWCSTTQASMGGCSESVGGPLWSPPGTRWAARTPSPNGERLHLHLTDICVCTCVCARVRGAGVDGHSLWISSAPQDSRSGLGTTVGRVEGV